MEQKIYAIHEVHCPPTCSLPKEKQGCYFRESPSHFTCTQCGLKIRRHFLGYELTPQDLHEIFQHKRTLQTKELIHKQKKFRAYLTFNATYDLRIYKDNVQRTSTQETCPTCGSQLWLITRKEPEFSQFYGCSKWPQCKYTKRYIPHQFQTTEPHSQESTEQTQAACAPHPSQTVPQQQSPQDTSPEDACNSSNVWTPLNLPPLKLKHNTTTPPTPTPTPALQSPQNHTHNLEGSVYKNLPAFILQLLRKTQPPTPVKLQTPQNQAQSQNNQTNCQAHHPQTTRTQQWIPRNHQQIQQATQGYVSTHDPDMPMNSSV